MCTVTAVLLHGGDCRSIGDAPVLRVICNRDEARTRADAIPPLRREFADRTAILPIDPLSQGTWIGVNDAGLVLCLLNASSMRPSVRSRPLRSRGDIVPSLLDCDSVAEVVARADRINPLEFPPFRLLAITRDQLAVLAADQSTLNVQYTRPMADPFFITSSSLGDEIVEMPRRQLFGDLVLTAPDLAAAQHTFHAHQWPGRLHLSVQMSRADARTVSRTVVEVAGSYARMIYHSVPDGPLAPNAPRQDSPGLAAPMTLKLCAAGAAA